MTKLYKVLIPFLALLLSLQGLSQSADKTKSFILNRLQEINPEEKNQVHYEFYLDYLIAIDHSSPDGKEHAIAVLLKDVSSIKIANDKIKSIVIQSKNNALYKIDDKEVINFFKKVLEKNPNQIKKTGELVIPINGNTNESSLMTALKYLVKIKGGKLIDDLF